MALVDVQIIAAPYDSGRRDWRMGRGPMHVPMHVLEHGLRNTLVAQGHLIASIDLSVDSVTEIATAFDVCRALSKYVRAAHDSQAFPLPLTGNCGSALGTVAGLDMEKTGIMWFDAHGEINTPDTTRSGFLDGMGLATMTGQCWQALAATVPGFSPVPDNHILLIGVRDLDRDESILLENPGISRISAAQIRNEGLQNALLPQLDRLRQDMVHLTAEPCVESA